MAGLYIHIPYCHSKCIYCDFFSTPRQVDMDEYISALLTEYDLRKNEINEEWETLYIGGGTPSIIPVVSLERLVNGLKERIDIRALQECTIEANPEDVTPEWVEAVVECGINRVSMGIQSFNDDELTFINRRHNAAKAVEAIKILRDNGISEISGDLIYGLPEQSSDDWLRSLDRLLDLQLPHFSAYLLSYEPGTRLYAMLQSGRIDEVSEDEACLRYHILCNRAREAGYEHYEISNFSLPGHNAVHNTNYWKDKPYLGLGVSAHSFDGETRRYNGTRIKDYISSLNNQQACFITEEETDDERHNDGIITALRTRQGIDLVKYRNHWGETSCKQLLESAKPHILAGKMMHQGNHLFITEQSMLISDRLMLDLIR